MYIYSYTNIHIYTYINMNIYIHMYVPWSSTMYTSPLSTHGVSVGRLSCTSVCEKATSHIWMSHATHTKESRHTHICVTWHRWTHHITYKWVVLTFQSVILYIWIYIWSCPMKEWGISRMITFKFSNMITFKFSNMITFKFSNMIRFKFSRAPFKSHTHESCHTYDWVTALRCMSHVT